MNKIRVIKSNEKQSKKTMPVKPAVNVAALRSSWLNELQSAKQTQLTLDRKLFFGA